MPVCFVLLTTVSPLALPKTSRPRPLCSSRDMLLQAESSWATWALSHALVWGLSFSATAVDDGAFQWCRRRRWCCWPVWLWCHGFLTLAPVAPMLLGLVWNIGFPPHYFMCFATKMNWFQWNSCMIHLKFLHSKWYIIRFGSMRPTP